ncbi:MAG: hypothetical protein P4L41_08855 [Flavipsychrobacter sp.]|nr:hypothetical protein [Flavipsychrobacter sp.]
MDTAQYLEVKLIEILPLLKECSILVVTATDLETNAIHKKIKPVVNYEKIIKTYDGSLTYYIGSLGNYYVVHVQSGMGSISRDSSIMTVTNALSRLKSKIVIMIGIAFGVEEKQRIGDVLLSEAVIPYNIKRIGKSITIQRGNEVIANKILVNRFKNIKTTWEYILPNGQIADLISTTLLSGEELIDNLKYRNTLARKFPNSKGGEMEGIGVSSACDGNAAWVIVKGICDFADGEKGTDKLQRQSLAIDAAISACMEVFNSDYALEDLGALPYNKNNDTYLRNILGSSDVLFDIYDNSKEIYYITRTEDDNLNSLLNEFSIWVYGPSGCGKSNIIIRNLINQNKCFIQVSLESYIDLEIDSFFYEILYELVSNTPTVSSLQKPKDFAECSKQIVKLLTKNYLHKELIIFIEEIPISSRENYKDFTSKLFSIIFAKTHVKGLEKIKFILSSINSPLIHIQDFQLKIYQYFKFIPMLYWERTDSISLVNMIEKEFKHIFPAFIKDELIEMSKGSPRFIKTFFRNVYSLNRTDDATLKNTLNETNRELNFFIND